MLHVSTGTFSGMSKQVHIQEDAIETQRAPFYVHCFESVKYHTIYKKSKVTDLCHFE